MKHKIIDAKSVNNLGGFNILYKKSWYTRWKYVRDKNNNIGWWSSRKNAQAYLNFLPKEK